MNKAIKVGDYIVEREGNKLVVMASLWKDRPSNVRLAYAVRWAEVGRTHLNRILQGRAKSVVGHDSYGKLRSKVTYEKGFVQVGCTKVSLTLLKRIARLLP